MQILGAILLAMVLFLTAVFLLGCAKGGTRSRIFEESETYALWMAANKPK